MAQRKIIQIDDEKCDGCGLCASACTEGAIQIRDGKAKLVSEIYCDGLGACLGECPQGALTITERCGYVLQGADVNLFLAQYALEQEKDKAKAKQYAETALKLATCDGPPYYYKVAYEEAERMLASLNV